MNSKEETGRYYIIGERSLTWCCQLDAIECGDFICLSVDWGWVIKFVSKHLEGVRHLFAWDLPGFIHHVSCAHLRPQRCISLCQLHYSTSQPLFSVRNILLSWLYVVMCVPSKGILWRLTSISRNIAIDDNLVTQLLFQQYTFQRLAESKDMFVLWSVNYFSRESNSIMIVWWLIHNQWTNDLVKADTPCTIEADMRPLTCITFHYNKGMKTKDFVNFFQGLWDVANLASLTERLSMRRSCPERASKDFAKKWIMATYWKDSKERKLYEIQNLP